jgi:hypothetical protein
LNHRLFEETLASVRSGLDELDHAAAWAAGRSLSLTEAIDLARSTLPSQVREVGDGDGR